MEEIVPIMIVAIIFMQVFFFVKNIKRMNEFANIFKNGIKSWGICRNPETNMVNGISGKGNTILKSIINSINKYLGNNSGSIIDFGLLKDAVDRHCDSVENDISTQIPLPLYLGLAGTMGGVIFGLWELLDSESISALMGSNKEQIDISAAANGINALLFGVAWAMGASICGIILTTVGSLLFKKSKLQEEEGKNSFLAWMQSKLLPELPSDTSHAMNNLVRNLNRFNATFAENSANLGDKLKAVNESYAIQADIIKAVHDMDVTKMARANVKVLQELKECTDKLELFNEYLSDIEGYTAAIHNFEEQFNEQAERLHILEEIRDFFRQHKGSIAQTVAEADKTLQESLKEIKNSTLANVADLHSQFVQQSVAFKEILQQEKIAFEEFLNQMNTQFSSQVSQMPQIVTKLDEISDIPARLDKLIEKIEKSNSQLAINVSHALKETIQAIKENNCRSVTPDGDSETMRTTSNWMKYTGLGALTTIAIACVFNIVIYFIPFKTQPQPASVEDVVTIKQSISAIADSIRVVKQDLVTSNSSLSKINVLPQNQQ